MKKTIKQIENYEQQKEFISLIKEYSDKGVSYEFYETPDKHTYLKICGNGNVFYCTKDLIRLPKFLTFENNGVVDFCGGKIEEIDDTLFFYNNGVVDFSNNELEKIKGTFKNNGDVLLSFNSDITKESLQCTFENNGDVYLEKTKIITLTNKDIFQNNGRVYF